MSSTSRKPRVSAGRPARLALDDDVAAERRAVHGLATSLSHARARQQRVEAGQARLEGSG